MVIVGIGLLPISSSLSTGVVSADVSLADIQNIIAGGYTDPAVVDSTRRDTTGGSNPAACTFDGSLWERIVGGLACMAYGIFKFASWLAILAALILNTVVDKLIVGMAELVRPGGIPSAVEEVWKVLRDLTNVFLVFLTVFIGIATIVGISGYGYKQLLWKVILAALFVNFSITLAYFVIDIGNFTAITIYSSLMTVSGHDPGTVAACRASLASIDVNPTSDDCKNKGIAGAFINLFSLSSLYDNNLGGNESIIESRWRLFFGFLLGAVFMLVAAFVFLAGAFLLIGRFIMLLFAIMVSPIGLVLWITGVGSVGRRWWHMLINQTLIAPLLLLFWFITYVVLRGLMGVSGNTDAERFDPVQLSAFSEVDTLYFIMMYIVGAGFLIASLVAAKSLGAYGASGAINMGRNMSRKSAMFVGGVAGAATVGAAAYGMRRGAGAVADKAESSKALKNMAASNSMIARTLAKTARATTQKVKSSSFDARALTGKAGQQWMGQSQKGGYTQWKKDKIKQEQEMAKWAAEPAPSGEDKRKRDQEVRQTNKDFAQYADGGLTRGNLDRNYVETENEVRKLRARQAKTTDPREQQLLQEKITTLEGRLGGMSEMGVNTEIQSKLQLETNQLEQELRNGKFVDKKTGKEVEMTAAERQAKQDQLKTKRAELQAVTEEIDSSYGYVDENVAKLDNELKDLEKQKADMVKEKKDTKGITEVINQRKADRATIVKFHEANRELTNMTAVGILDKDQRVKLEQEVAKSEAGITALQGRRGAEVDSKYNKKWEDEGKARKEVYVNRVSTQRGFVGTPTPQWRRELGKSLREPDAKAKKLAAIEDFLKEYEADEAKGGAGTSTTGTGTTPITPSNPPTTP